MHVKPGDIVQLIGEVITTRQINGALFSCQVRTPEGDFWLPSTILGATSHGEIEAPEIPEDATVEPTDSGQVETKVVEPKSKPKRGKKVEVATDPEATEPPVEGDNTDDPEATTEGEPPAEGAE